MKEKQKLVVNFSDEFGKATFEIPYDKEHVPYDEHTGELLSIEDMKRWWLYEKIIDTIAEETGTAPDRINLGDVWITTEYI